MAENKYIQRIDALLDPVVEEFEAREHELAEELREVRAKIAKLNQELAEAREAYEEACEDSTDAAQSIFGRVQVIEDRLKNLASREGYLKSQVANFDDFNAKALAEAFVEPSQEATEIVQEALDAAVAEKAKLQKLIDEYIEAQHYLCNRIRRVGWRASQKSNPIKVRVPRHVHTGRHGDFNLNVPAATNTVYNN